MRITIVYEDVRLALDVKPDDTVGTLKKILNSKMIIETTEDKKVGKYLEMKFGGAPLRHKWVLQDIGVTSGSIIKCALKTVEKPKLIIHLAYNEETLLITEDIDPIKIKVGEIRSIIAGRLGIPVSVFRLSYDAPRERSANSAASRKANRSGAKSGRKGKELYDTNTLDYYEIEIGSKVTLDLWDGWNELILSAIAGHEKIVSQYFSWEKSVRAFQQKAALYIAAFYGHMGLATAMMKRGAKGYEPVGIHPFRKWCFESEHPETQRCPLHVACLKGHLPILRLFVKSSPLCFITKDENGKTPLQIVLRCHHRACFEFLIARQWGRKTGKDFSFSMTLYCRIMRWCERAKIHTLLMHGTDKSTFKGLPQKEGALVGTSVLVDGFSKKPANSVPYAMVPRPAIPPEKMLYTLAMTKRKMRAIRRQRSSFKILSRRSSVLSMSSGKKVERKSSATSVVSTRSSVSFDKFNYALESSCSNFKNYGNQLSSYGNSRNASKKYAQFSDLTSKSQTPSRKEELNFAVNSNNFTTSAPQLNSITEKKQTDETLPSIPQAFLSKDDKSKFSRKDSKISFKNDNILRKNSNTRQFQSFAAIKPQGLQPTPAVKRPPLPIQAKVPEQSGIPLPAKSLEKQLKPFFYWSRYEKGENPVDITLHRFRAHRGVTPRQNAVQCLTVTSTFTEKPWLQQLRMAVRLTKRGVKKNYESQTLTVNT